MKGKETVFYWKSFFYKFKFTIVQKKIKILFKSNLKLFIFQIKIKKDWSKIKKRWLLEWFRYNNITVYILLLKYISIFTPQQPFFSFPIDTLDFKQLPSLWKIDREEFSFNLWGLFYCPGLWLTLNLQYCTDRFS